MSAAVLDERMEREFANSSKWSVFLLSIPLGLLTLWDFYIGEVRFLDFAALLAAAVIVISLRLVGRDSLHFDRRAIPALGGVFGIVLVYTIVGMSAHPDNVKPSLGLMFGVSTYFLARGLCIEERSFDRALAWIVSIHMTALYLQLAYYYSTRQVLNYHAIVGLQPRLLSGIFRPAGLFLEPAVYSFFAASMLFLRRQRNLRFGVLDTLLLLSMYLSLSLWGLAVATLILCIFLPRFTVALFTIIGILMLFVVSTLDLTDSPIYRFFEGRITGLGTDSSAAGRYGGTLSWLAGVLSDPTILFGNGINNFFEELGSNGWTFIINSLGLIGTTALFVFFSFAGRPRKWPFFLLSSAVLFTAAPLWKDFYVWCWLGLMLRDSESQAGKQPYLADA